MLLTFWQAPVPAGNSSTVSHVDMPSLWYRYTMIQLVASAALHASLYPTTSHSKPLRLATPSTPVEAEGLEPTIAESPPSKKRAVVLRLPASQQVGKELGKLHGTGLYKCP